MNRLLVKNCCILISAVLLSLARWFLNRKAELMAFIIIQIAEIAMEAGISI